MDTVTFGVVIDILISHYGPPTQPPVTSALEMILWENVAYLADDERRMRAFEMLRETVGVTPEAILAAGDDTLLEVARHGIVPEQTVAKLRNIAAIMLTDFPDGLEPVLLLPHKQAVKALRKFPAIGEPAADKILLFTRTLPVFSLESNGLRVLQRIGYGSGHGQLRGGLPRRHARYCRRVAVRLRLAGSCLSDATPARPDGLSPGRAFMWRMPREEDV